MRWGQAKQVPRVPSVCRMRTLAGELSSNSHSSCGETTSSLQKSARRLRCFAQQEGRGVTATACAAIPALALARAQLPAGGGAQAKHWFTSCPERRVIQREETRFTLI